MYAKLLHGPILANGIQKASLDPSPFEYYNFGQMYYIYLIKSVQNNSYYIGRTRNVVNRLKQHNAGLGIHTKKYRPWVCVYIEGYRSEKDAINRERNLKIFGKAYGQLKRRLLNSLQIFKR